MAKVNSKVNSKVNTKVKTNSIGSKVNTKVKTNSIGSKVNTKVKTNSIGSKVNTNTKVKTNSIGSKVNTNTKVKTTSIGSKVNTNVKRKEEMGCRTKLYNDYRSKCKEDVGACQMYSECGKYGIGTDNWPITSYMPTNIRNRRDADETVRMGMECATRIMWNDPGYGPQLSNCGGAPPVGIRASGSGKNGTIVTLKKRSELAQVGSHSNKQNVNFH
jgi:hypothetical protein